MKLIFILFIALIKIIKNDYISQSYFRFNEIYRIYSLSTNQFVSLNNNNFILSIYQRQFRFFHIISNIY